MPPDANELIIQQKCPTTTNPDQADADGDDVGDACDLATCGNGVRECDGGDDGQRPGLCVACQRAVCGTVIPDTIPLPKVIAIGGSCRRHVATKKTD